MRPAVCRSVGRGAAVGQSDGLRVFERGSIPPLGGGDDDAASPSIHASTYSACCLDEVNDYGYTVRNAAACFHVTDPHIISAPYSTVG